MDLLKNFGIDPVLLVAQIINFFILLYLLKRFLYKSIAAMLSQRKQTIEEGLRKGEEGRKLLEEAETKQKELLKDARDQAASFIKDAKERSEAMIAETEATMKKRGDALLRDAKIQIQEETKKAEQQLLAKVSTMAIQFLQQSLKDLYSEEDQEKLVLKAIRQIKKERN